LFGYIIILGKIMIKNAFFITAITAVVATMLLGSSNAYAGSESCDTRVNNTQAKLLECITLDAVRQHQAALQSVADANGGNRAAGTSGYDASVDYVVGVLEAAGYTPELNEFDYLFQPPATLTQTAPALIDHETGTFTGSGFGRVDNGNVIPVDLNLADPGASTSGCEGPDYAGLDFSGPNDIALIQRGACFFSVKAAIAQFVGAEAVVIMNQGTVGRTELIVANAATFPDGSPSNLTIPVVGASFASGVSLAELGSTATVDAPASRIVTQVNVLAELPGKNADNVVMVGGHLDSVIAGPGVQDNGSGTAAILETAVQMAKVKPRNTVRFAWWGGEEAGLVGSFNYVFGLSQEERDRIALYLNFDMIGSPNAVLFVYDGDDSDGVGAGPGPEGSAQIEALFEQFYTQVGVPYKGSDFTGRSDYGPFIFFGIPAGGLFTGAEGIKTPDEAAIWGGVAGEQYDPCYHLACDTFDNINLAALELNANAVAFATLQYAMNTETVNGIRGKGNYMLKDFLEEEVME
jgi:Zn-dependent M28 family amino/carboxypeptidase